MRLDFKTISTILIILLVSILIGILVNYYNTPLRVVNIPVIEINTSGDISASNHDNPIIISENNSGEFVSNNGLRNENDLSKESIITESGEINSKSDKNDKNNQVIISSEDTMTNREKKDILTELDNTLMELLDVVDKVQTVDETRLITEEGELQK